MAYNFENKQAENDPDVKLYLDEGMHFEAWTMIIRHWEGDFDELWEKLEQEFMKKSTQLTQDEIDTLNVEFFYYRDEAEKQAWINEQLGGEQIKNPHQNTNNGGLLIYG